MWVATETDGKVSDGLVLVRVATAVVTRARSVHLLTLKLALDPLAVRRVTNQRQDRANAFDKL